MEKQAILREIRDKELSLLAVAETAISALREYQRAHAGDYQIFKVRPLEPEDGGSHAS
jgi:hypothetical protein